MSFLNGGDLSVFLTPEQARRLIADPDMELVIYYPDGTRVIVRISEDYLGENTTMH